MINLNRSEQNGRSMVEMLGVLAIIGVFSVGGIAGYSKAMTKFKINKSMDQISMLVANIRTLFSGQRNYSGLNNANAVSFGIILKEMRQYSCAGIHLNKRMLAKEGIIFNGIQNSSQLISKEDGYDCWRCLVCA